MIKIEFPADRTDIALALGEAFTKLGQGAVKAGEKLKDFGAVVEECTEQPTLDEQAVADVEADQQLAADLPDAVAQQAAGTHKVDEKGVPFNAEFCSKAASPFYGSGKKKGQWKKRQGVEEPKYDYWYDEELIALREAAPETTDTNIAADTFGQQPQTETDDSKPQNVGELMKWVSEQQAAGNLSQEQVTGSYAVLGLPLDAIMNPAHPVAENCGKMYDYLNGLIA